MVQQAKVEGGVPQGGGWFVVNARDSRWLYNELGGYCPFEGSDEARFPQLGINLNVLPPGKPMTMYHGEASPETFFVVKGECLLIVEGEERALAGDERQRLDDRAALERDHGVCDATQLVGGL